VHSGSSRSQSLGASSWYALTMGASRPPLALTWALGLLNAACGARPELGAPLPVTTGLAPRPIVFAEGDAGFCALRAPGRLVCWGGDFGPEMRALDDATDYVEVAVGAHGACGLRRGGEVRCGSASAAPAPVIGLPPAVQLGADAHRTCALTADGQVFCLGESGESSGPPAPLPGVSGARRLSVADRFVCVVEADGGVRCLGGFGERPADDRVPGLSGVVDLRHSGLIACGRTATGDLQCAPLPHPSTGFGSGPTWPIPLESLRYPHVDDAADVVVELATVCARPVDGRWRCAGEAHGAPIDADRLVDLDSSAALLLVDPEIGCGLDADGTLRTQSRAKGFCGEADLQRDGSGRDLVEARRAGYSAETSPRFRLGGQGGAGETRLAAGLSAPLLFGRPERTLVGPTFDLSTAAFDTVAPAGGLMVEVPLGGPRLGFEALGGASFDDGEAVPFFGGGVRFGAAMVLTDAACSADCGLRYTASAGLAFSVRRTLGPAPGTEYVLAVDFDPAALLAPFALLSADWKFH
jgi:hypothetical protein